MREMTASEVSRNLSRVLDAADNGETIAVTRNGERVALLVPAPRANGAALAEVFRKSRQDPTDRTILTRDARARFDELPGVQARVVSS